MRKLRSNLLACALVTGLLGSVPVGVDAVTFTITGGSWSLDSGWAAACLSTEDCDDSDTFMNVSWAIHAGLAQSFDLTGVGDSFTLTFGTGLWSEEDNDIESGETDDLDVTGILSISSPLSTGNSNIAVVVATEGTAGDAHNDLTATFAPVLVSFGSGGQFQVDLSDPVWTCNPRKLCEAQSSESQTITAKFTLVALPPTNGDGGGGGSSVPEPNTVALAGLGLLSLAFLRRRQRA